MAFMYPDFDELCHSHESISRLDCHLYLPAWPFFACFNAPWPKRKGVPPINAMSSNGYLPIAAPEIKCTTPLAYFLSHDHHFFTQASTASHKALRSTSLPVRWQLDQMQPGQRIYCPLPMYD